MSMNPRKRALRRAQVGLFGRCYSVHLVSGDRWTTPTRSKGRARRQVRRLGPEWVIVKFGRPAPVVARGQLEAGAAWVRAADPVLRLVDAPALATGEPVADRYSQTG